MPTSWEASCAPRSQHHRTSQSPHSAAVGSRLYIADVVLEVTSGGTHSVMVDLPPLSTSKLKTRFAQQPAQNLTAKTNLKQEAFLGYRSADKSETLHNLTCLRYVCNVHIYIYVVGHGGGFYVLKMLVICVWGPEI